MRAENAALLLLVMATPLLISVDGKTRNLAEFLELKGYDRAKRPQQGGNKTIVKLDIYVDSFGKIEEVNMEVSVYMYLRQMWTDTRLAGFTNETVTLNREGANLVWRPDTYCINARVSDMMQPDKELHSALKLSPDGSIFYSRNTHVVASCDMDLHDFPMDNQQCDLSFGSYGFTSNLLDYEWQKKTITVAKRNMAQFSVKPTKLTRSVDEYSSGNYSSLSGSFVLHRHVGYYMIQLYLPCIFLVMLSWIVFWMTPENGGDRLTVGITCILTIVFLLGYINSMLPKVSYAKGVDWYLMTSFFFIFLTLAECVLVERLMNRKKKNQPQDDAKNSTGQSANPTQCSRNQVSVRRRTSSVLPESADDEGTKAPTDVEQHITCTSRDQSMIEVKSRSKCSRGMSRTILALAKQQFAGPTPVKVDKLSRVLFPLSYALYNAGYWYVYLYGVKILS